MKMEKLEREKEQFLKRNKNSVTKNEILEKKLLFFEQFQTSEDPCVGISESKTTNDSIDSHSNLGGDKKNEVSSIQTGTVLPAIKSTKNKERIERLKLKNEDDGSVEEINDMVTKIMNEF